MPKMTIVEIKMESLKKYSSNSKESRRRESKGQRKDGTTRRQVTS